jgi:hypothetical protein
MRHQPPSLSSPPHLTSPHWQTAGGVEDRQDILFGFLDTNIDIVLAMNINLLAENM